MPLSLNGRATKKRPLFFCGFPKPLWLYKLVTLNMLCTHVGKKVPEKKKVIFVIFIVIFPYDLHKCLELVAKNDTLFVLPPLFLSYHLI